MEPLKKFYASHREIVIRAGLTLAAFVIVIIAFGVLADEVHEGDTLNVDRGILLWINARSSPLLDAFMVHITDLGSVLCISVVTVAIAAYLVSKKMYVKTFLLLASIGGAAILNFTLKLFFQRARPELWERLVTESNFSFPSGHAMGSSALAFTIIALLWNTRWRIPAIVIGALYIIVIGSSRLYLGVHYPTDVLGGWLVSFAWVLAVSLIVYTHLYKKRRSQERLAAES